VLIPRRVVGVEVAHEKVGGVQGELCCPTLQLVCRDGGRTHVHVGYDKGVVFTAVFFWTQLQLEYLVFVCDAMSEKFTVRKPLAD
jgi:hypothetical protein